MANTCGECQKLDWSNKERWSSVDRYYCKAGHGYKEPTERACSYDFTYNKDSKNGSSDDGYQPSGCPCSVIVRDILGFADDCDVLTTLRNFRETILRPNLEYLPILVQYDRVGAIISSKLTKIADNYRICAEIFKNFLFPCVSAINAQDINGAIAIFKNMIAELRCILEIPEVEQEFNLEDIDLQNVGKGRCMPSPLKGTI